jgi:YebC/PmpR family DNA-binding regulatory protein
MAGHSHAANVAGKKAVIDKKRGALFGKLARLIIVAARTGGGDPEMNLRLKYAIEKARAANMTNDSIKRAVQKGTGELQAASFEEVVYEGYAPGGIAVLVTGLTDNRTRTAGEVKSIFDHRGGAVGTPGSVAWQFDRKAVVRAGTAGKSEDEVFLAAADAGAEDLRRDGDFFEVVGPPEAMGTLRDALEKAGLPVTESELRHFPRQGVEVGEVEAARRVLLLVSELEDHDDLQAVVHNAVIPDEVRVAAAAEE